MVGYPSSWSMRVIVSLLANSVRSNIRLSFPRKMAGCEGRGLCLTGGSSCCLLRCQWQRVIPRRVLFGPKVGDLCSLFRAYELNAITLGLHPMIVQRCSASIPAPALRAFEIRWAAIPHGFTCSHCLSAMILYRAFASSAVISAASM